MNTITFSEQAKIFGHEFSIERNNQIIATIVGIENTEQATKRPYIGFAPDSDIQIGDIIINSSNEKFIIVDKKTQYYLKELYQLKAFYLSEAEYNNQQNKVSSTIFNITNATNSIIGNGNITTINYQELLSDFKSQVEKSTEDKEELRQIVSLLEVIVNNTVPPQKGLFSKFSSIMEKHSWITGTVSNIILNWLLTPKP